MNERPESAAIRKARKRREAGLCVGCGKKPCVCKRPRRKQKFATIKTPDMPRKRS